MLALAKVEQLRQQGDPPVLDWAAIVRAVALDLSPLIADKQLDFELDDRSRPGARARLDAARADAQPAAQRHQADARRLARWPCAWWPTARTAALTVADSGPGIARRAAQPPVPAVSASRQLAGRGQAGGSGLGLAICREIVQSLGGSIQLDNRERGGRTEGLDAIVRLPLATR